MSTYAMLLPPAQLATPLLAWYYTVHANREMPWRKSRDPYAIWLSEIMLQQTQVETVKPYYFRFLEHFPTIAELAAAPLEEVLALWAGLGYYRRAKHLHLAAKKVVADHEGAIPGELEKLRELPGVGRYTAGAIASIAFNVPAPVVDGNVMRVLSRLTGYDQDIALPKNHDFFWKAAEEVVRGAVPVLSATSDTHTYGDVNQAIMELGATICVPPPARPACLLCPVREFCKAFAEGTQMALPVKSRREATPVVRGTALVMLRKKRTQVLLMQRPAGSMWEHMWEFPVFAGKISPKAAHAFLQTLTPKAAELVPSGKVKHQLTHRTMVYGVIHAELTGGKIPDSLPLCGDAGKPYLAARWVEWPVEARGERPVSKVVHKIAQQVSSVLKKSSN